MPIWIIDLVSFYCIVCRLFNAFVCVVSNCTLVAFKPVLVRGVKYKDLQVILFQLVFFFDVSPQHLQCNACICGK